MERDQALPQDTLCRTGKSRGHYNICCHLWPSESPATLKRLGKICPRKLWQMSNLHGREFWSTSLSYHFGFSQKIECVRSFLKEIPHLRQEDKFRLSGNICLFERLAWFYRGIYSKASTGIPDFCGIYEQLANFRHIY